MPIQLPQNLPIATLRLTFKVTSTMRLPEYAGSMLRGAFGHALRRTACMTRGTDCKACPLYQSCPYPQIFEPPVPEQHTLQKFSQIPAPYMIHPPAWGEKTYHTGETLQFDMTLIGRARQHLPLIIYAWQRAFTHRVGHGTAQLHAVAHIAGNDSKVTEQDNDMTANATPNTTPNIELYDASKQSLRAYPIHELTQPIELILPSHTPSQYTLHWETPLRLQNNGKALPPKELNAATLLKAIARRAHLLLEFHAEHTLVQDFGALIGQMEPITETKAMIWQDWTRHSSRQNTLMKMGGVKGTWQLHQVSPAWANLLHIGQHLHVGKETTFGMGRYRIQQTQS